MVLEQRLPRRFVSDVLVPLVIAVFVFGALALLQRGHRSGYDNFTYLAEAFLRGRVYIDWPGENIDALLYNGRRYVIEGPLPGVLMMPTVALFGRLASQTLLSHILCAVGAAAAWTLLRRLAVGIRPRITLVAFLLLGTDFFWCAIFGDVWFIAHVSAVSFTLLALCELLGRRRGWLVMLWAVCAFESRFTMVLVIPIYAAMLWVWVEPARRRATAIGAAIVLGAAASLWLAYNFARWGVPYDIGYNAFYHKDPVGSPTGSPFALRYLPMQIDAFFVLMPQFASVYPYVIPLQAGTALTWTSPGLFTAFFGWRPWRLALAMWLATILCAAPNFVYYVIGFAQFGMRHALDFEPFLFVLMGMAAARRLALWQSILCWFSVLAGAWGVWIWITQYRSGG